MFLPDDGEFNAETCRKNTINICNEQTLCIGWYNKR